VLDHTVRQEVQVVAPQSHLVVEADIYCLARAEVGIAKAGKAVLNQQTEAYRLAAEVDHCLTVGKKGIGKAVVDHLHTTIDHNLMEVRRSPGAALTVVVTLMVVEVDDRTVLIEFGVLDRGVSLVHCFRESRIHFHFHFLSSGMVQIRFP
jgi:hypothetical protein